MSRGTATGSRVGPRVDPTRETLCVYETLLERGFRLDPDPPPDR
jgi:hypothetical protein